MQPPKDDLGYWLGWGVAFGVAGAFFIFIVSQDIKIYGVFCSQADTNCGREWISALAGWAGAVIAAVPIVYLARQVRIAARQHQDTWLLQASGQIALAKSALNYAWYLEQVAVFCRARNYGQLLMETDRQHAFLEMLEYLQRLYDQANHDIFNQFETAFGTWQYALDHRILKKAISAHQDRLKSGELNYASIGDFASMREGFRKCAELAATYATGCKEVAEDFLAKANKMAEDAHS